MFSFFLLLSRRVSLVVCLLAAAGGARGDVEPLGDAPLTLGERRLPGRTPSHTLRFSDPLASSVEVRHSGNGFAGGPAMTKNGDVWELDVRELQLGPGWSRFKFLPDGEWEEGPDRDLYLDAEGRAAKPPAVYLTWQRDPTTTMTVLWHNYDPAQNELVYRAEGAEEWSAPREADVAPFPFTERFVHTAEITGLKPGGVYEFRVGGYDETFRFRTAPEGLTQPLTFAAGGDVDTGEAPDAVSAAVGARDPLFAVIGGDHAYADGRAEFFAKWYRYFESFFHNLRAPDGRLIPLVVAIGNHEVREGYAEYSPEFDDSAEWRRRHAPYFFTVFPFPGAGQPYGVLDFGNYLSLLMTDTEHSSPLISGDDPQSRWLRQALAERRGVGHVFPVHHVPAYTSYRPFDDPISERIRRHWVPLYEDAGVQLVFENHDHTYKRTKPLRGGVEHPDGIIYVGDGAWGVGTRTPATDRPYLEKAEQKHHALLVTVEPDRWQVEAVDGGGEVLDRFERGN
jgi:hypothetical protein